MSSSLNPRLKEAPNGFCSLSTLCPVPIIGNMCVPEKKTATVKKVTEKAAEPMVEFRHFHVSHLQVISVLNQLDSLGWWGGGWRAC